MNTDKHIIFKLYIYINFINYLQCPLFAQPSHLGDVYILAIDCNWVVKFISREANKNVTISNVLYSLISGITQLKNDMKETHECLPLNTQDVLR